MYEDREQRIKGFEQLAKLALKEGKILRCIGYDVDVDPTGLDRLDRVTRSFYSKCQWILVDKTTS